MIEVICIFGLMIVVMVARQPLIASSYTGAQLRSTVYRMYRHQTFLDKVATQIHLCKLQGTLFFGTVNQLSRYIVR